MLFKRNSDGTMFESLDKAVDAFRCPGPCNPDCALYQVKQLPGTKDLYGHMCHPKWYNANPGELCEALGLTPVPSPVFVVNGKFVFG